MKEKTYRIHYFGRGENRGKKTVINDWENFTALNSEEAKEKAMTFANKVKEIHGITHLTVDVHELQFVTFFELKEAN